MSAWERYAIFAVILAGISSLLTLVFSNWRRSLLTFALQYLAVFWLCHLTLSLSMAGIKLLTGLVAAITLASIPIKEKSRPNILSEPGWIFRLVAGLLIWVVVISLESNFANILPGSEAMRLGGLLLMVMGLFELGITREVGKVMLGLLTALAGFEVLYAMLETSTLVTGLMALMNLGLAFTGAFLLSTGAETEAE